jgi:hypothetical protein
MNAVPFAFTGVMAAMAAVNWIVGRRMRVQDDSQGDGDTRREHG